MLCQEVTNPRRKPRCPTSPTYVTCTIAELYAKCFFVHQKYSKTNSRKIRIKIIRATRLTKTDSSFFYYSNHVAVLLPTRTTTRQKPLVYAILTVGGLLPLCRSAKLRREIEEYCVKTIILRATAFSSGAGTAPPPERTEQRHSRAPTKGEEKSRRNRLLLPRAPFLPRERTEARMKYS